MVKYGETLWIQAGCLEPWVVTVTSFEPGFLIYITWNLIPVLQDCFKDYGEYLKPAHSKNEMHGS